MRLVSVGRQGVVLLAEKEDICWAWACVWAAARARRRRRRSPLRQGRRKAMDGELESVWNGCI
jgi:hypothetical protein